VNPTGPDLTPFLPIRVERDDARGISLNFPMNSEMTGSAQARNPRPEVLEVVFPGVDLTLASTFKLKSPLVESVSSSYDGAGTVLTFTFDRAMATELWMDGKIVRLTIKRPLRNGNLAGMTIVVDPGHGGHDTGTRAGGVSEKDLNLIMGQLIASKLAAEGVTVILTRKTDVFIPLTTRAKIANENDADLFISSHINSTAKGGSQSGSITFHHKGSDVSQFLAECIQDEIAKVSGLPDKGAWSDGRIYDSGFSVLRNTKMPGVLLELGFINNTKDRARMITKDFQDKVAAAVVKGIKVYLSNGS
jgi:N-acetylmuramoyl-L-alanine amidase